MQQLLIEPSRSLGPFVLGSALNDVIAIVQREGGSLRENRLTFDPQDPLSRELVLELLDVAIRLRFSSLTQRLTLIDCYQPWLLTFRYRHSALSGQAHAPPSLSSVYQTVGPTYPPYWDEELQVYLLQYPGLCFAFASTGDAAAAVQTSDFEVMDHTQTALCRLFVHCGPQVQAPAPTAGLSDGAESLVQLHADLGVYVPELRVWLRLGSHVQDALSDVGPPDAITRKSDNKMRIHAALGSDPPHRSLSRAAPSADSDAESASAASDYFFNFTRLGLDLLIDGRSGLVLKVIAHCNPPGGREFGHYRKCHSLLFLRLAAPAASDDAAVHGAQQQQQQQQQEQQQQQQQEEDVVAVNCNARWSEMERAIKACGGEVSRGMINGGGEPGENPFGSTMFYATRGALFEVLKSGYVQSITLF